MTHSPEFHAQLKDFARRFVAAIAEGSAVDGAQLMMSHQEYVALTGDTNVSAEDHAAAAQAQFEAFLHKYRKFIDRYRDRLLPDAINDVSTYRLRDSEAVNGVELASVQIVSFNLQSITLDNGDISRLYFQVDDGLVIDGEVRVTHFEFVRAGESIDDTSKNLDPLSARGIVALAKADFVEMTEPERWSGTRFLADDRWVIATGDLTLDAELIALLKGYCVLVTGDLTIKGHHDYDNLGALAVLGDVGATSLMLTDLTCYVKGATRVDDVLWVFGEGRSVTINRAVGRFVFNESDGAEINASPDDVEACTDWATGRQFGDLLAVLGPDLCTTNDDGQLTVDQGALHEWIQNGIAAG